MERGSELGHEVPSRRKNRGSTPGDTPEPVPSPVPSEVWSKDGADLDVRLHVGDPIRRRPVTAAAQEPPGRIEPAVVEREKAVTLVPEDDVLQVLTSCDHCREHALPLARIYERMYRAIEFTGDSVVITNRDGIIEYVNPAFEATTGYSAAEVMGRTPRLLKSGVHDSSFYAEMWQSLLAGQTFRGTVVNRKKTGQQYSAEQTISPVPDADGTITHFVSVLKDITMLLQRKEEEVLLLLAREIQQRFYAESGTLAGFDLHAMALPVAETGGDYFDFLPGSDGSLSAVLADVSGHGFGAALIMSETRAYCRAFATIYETCSEVLQRVNEHLYSDIAGRAFVTMSMLHVNPRDRTFVFSGAGHVPGVLVSADGTTRQLRSGGLPLGLFPDARIRSDEAVRIAPGDVVVMMTDGITEAAAPGGEEFGLEQAIEMIARHRSGGAKEIADVLVAAALKHSGGYQTDDLAVLVCKADDAATASQEPE